MYRRQSLITFGFLLVLGYRHYSHVASCNTNATKQSFRLFPNKIRYQSVVLRFVIPPRIINCIRYVNNISCLYFWLVYWLYLKARICFYFHSLNRHVLKEKYKISTRKIQISNHIYIHLMPRAFVGFEGNFLIEISGLNPFTS